MFSLALTQTPPQGEEGWKRRGGERSVSGCECCRIGERYGVCGGGHVHVCACMYMCTVLAGVDDERKFLSSSTPASTEHIYIKPLPNK